MHLGLSQRPIKLVKSIENAQLSSIARLQMYFTAVYVLKTTKAIMTFA